MIKNIQTKIILIFFILGILIIGSLSLSHVMMLKKMNQSIIENEEVQFSEEQKNKMQKEVKEQIGQTEVITVIAIGSFSVIMILIGYFNTKSVVKPVNSLIESAEKIAKGEEVEIAHLDKKKTQIDELVNAFSLMTK